MRYCPSVVLFFCFSCLAHAELPLTVENLVTAPNLWRYELGLNYFNNYRSTAQSGTPLVIQTGPTSFLNIPTFAGAQNENTDTLVITPGIRYGLTPNAEIYCRTSWLTNTSRVATLSDVQTQSNSQIADIWLGANFEVQKEDEHPGLIVFSEVAAAENQHTNIHNAKSGSLGFTTYRTNEPLVFALTTAWRFSSTYYADGISYRNGNILFVNPSINFAVNPVATMTFGFSWRHQHSERIQGVSQGPILTRTDFSLGLNYGYDELTTMVVNLRGNLSGNGGAEIGMLVVHKIDRA